tara:strand:+ start:411 stop:701 length:291 start_codon:yes stop_codon:yes gene_type:complete
MAHTIPSPPATGGNHSKLDIKRSDFLIYKGFLEGGFIRGMAVLYRVAYFTEGPARKLCERLRAAVAEGDYGPVDGECCRSTLLEQTAEIDDGRVGA